MTTLTGSVTITGSTGASASFTVTNDAFGLSIASSFQSMVATLEQSPGVYSYPTTTPPAFARPAAAFAVDPTTASSFMTIASNLGTVAVVGPQGSSALLVGDGTSFVYSGPITGSASAVIVGGDGDDTVLSGVGNDTISLGSGHNDYLVGVSGTIDSSGTDIIVGGVGTTVVTVSGSNTDVATSDFSGSQLNVDNSAGTNTSIFAVNRATILGASASVTTVDGYGPTTVTAGAGGTNYQQYGGTVNLTAESGETDTVSAATIPASSGAPTMLYSGPDTLYGGGGSTVVFSNSTANNVFVANDPKHGANGTPIEFNAGATTVGNQFWAGSGNATLIGGTGADTIVAGNGMSTLTGGSGSANSFDLFSVAGGAATQVTITDFNAASGNDIVLFDYGASAAAYAIANQSQLPNGTGTLITLSDKSTIMLQGVTSNLNSSQIKYT